MPKHDFKKTGLLRAGFQYQDLVAIETLIDFYRQRDLYAWVQLEAEGQEFRSIEDVVACRPDGLYELIQVKFTADPDANHLSWKWLTTNGGTRKKSLLQKWAATTLLHKKAGNLAQAALKTDRVPDAALAKCLKGTKVDYTLLTKKDKAIVEKQLGSHKAAQSFFESFEFIHSLPRLDDLEEKLWSRIASDTDSGGWFQFRAQVQRWSTRKRQPTPDGKIKHIHLRQAFSVERSKPLPQGFLVPPAYNVPDEDFDREFLEEITGSEGLTVLWGPPGCGKSTYLSHCVESIDQQNIVCIRHHYFLSLDDRSEGRFHYPAIVQSLTHQLEKTIPDLQKSSIDKNFGEILETAAHRLQEEGRLLIVVIDGLDHVWRDHRDHEDMEMLFNALLPLPANIRLVVGTQKIAREHLPASLLKALPTDHWTELPLMSQAAVHCWLSFQDKAGRLNVEVVGRQTHDQVVRAVANAFHDISQGLPLHLIYSFEAIARTGNAVTTEDIAALPACPTGDIRDYYCSFWQRIGAKARTILHVLTGLEFGPPPFAMNDCFGRTDDSFLALDEINHLLDYRETEVRPFHGSLFAFVQDLPEHDDTFLTHASDVLTWIETDAPEYWRWAWLWITKAQLGDPSDLLASPNREWAINSLVAGFPIEQLITILDHAEKAAFNAFDLPRLLTLRLLKTRVVNGPEFQTNEWPLFQEIAVSLSEDPHIQAQALLRATLHRASVDLLPFIVRSTDEFVRANLAKATIAELNQRILRLQPQEMGADQSYHDLARAIVAVLANDGSQSAQRVLEYTNRFGKAEAKALIATYVQESLLVSNFDNIFEVGKQWSRHDIDHNIFAALCFEGLDPATKPELKALAHPAIRCLALLKGGTAKKSRAKKDLSRLFVEDDYSEPGFVHNTSDAMYEVFFAALATGLSGGEAQGWSDIPANAQKTWLSEAVRALERLAGGIAEEWRASQRWPTLQDIYSDFELQPPAPRSQYAQRLFITVRFALRDIAVDLCTIAKGLDSNALIDVSDIDSISMSPFWLDEVWLHQFTDKWRLPLHTPEAAQALVERVGHNLDTEIREFNERAQDATKLAMFASDYDLIPLAQKELKRAAECLLGYGYHKDLFALEVLESLDLLAKKGDTDAQKAMLDLAGEFEAITDYTDGDETDHVRREYYKAIFTHFPERVPACYAHLIRAGEWRYAEALASTIAETNQIESRTGRALLESYITPSEISVLEEQDLATRPHTEAALIAVRRKTGRVGEVMSEQEETMTAGDPYSISDDAESEEDEISIPGPSEFPPGQLEEYLSATRNVDYDDRRKLIIKWLKYWEAAGHADEVLTALEATTSETRYDSDLDNALDVAFEIALKTQGRSKAFPWLVRAHITRYGWHPWFTGSDEAQARMRIVAQHYRGQWQEFIKNTSKPVLVTEIERNGIVIGLSRLVYFLVKVGEMETARVLALEMTRMFKEELTGQSIKAPEWSK